MVRYRSNLKKNIFNLFHKKNSLKKYKVNLNLNNKLKIKLKKLYSKYVKMYSNFFNLKIAKAFKQMIKAMKRDFFESFREWNWLHYHNPKTLKTEKFNFYLIKTKNLNFFLFNIQYHRNFKNKILPYFFKKNKYRSIYYNKSILTLKYVDLSIQFNFLIFLNILKNLYTIPSFLILYKLKLK